MDGVLLAVLEEEILDQLHIVVVAVVVPVVALVEVLLVVLAMEIMVQEVFKFQQHSKIQHQHQLQQVAV